MKFLHTIRKHPIRYAVGLMTVIVIISSVLLTDKKKEVYETMIVAKSDLVQEVEATGKVHSSEERSLSFQRGGNVSSVFVSVGDEVVPGAQLASLNVSELQAQLRQAEASIAEGENTLAELKRGSRPEDITVSRTAVSNAERSRDDAQSSYLNTVEKVKADLFSAHDGALTTAQSAVVSAKNALVTVSEIQYSRFSQTGLSAEGFPIAKQTAVKKLFDTSNTSEWTAENISGLMGGVYGQVLSASVPASDDASFDSMLSKTREALLATSEALEAMPILTSFDTTDKANLSAQKTAISTAISGLSARLQVVEVQKIANASALTTAKAGVTTAENALRGAQDALALKEAGSTQEAISSQNSRLASAYAQKELVLAQMDTMILRSPIHGVVTKQDARRGVFVQAGVPVVSIISKNNYEVEVFVPEVDISKISIGDTVDITLDAYTDDDIFKATVASVDPAETVLEGVATYKVTISFVEGEDERIRSGMTANAIIFTDERKDVFVVPTRALVTEDSQKYVRILKDGEMQKIPVVVGLKGSDGRTEIKEGLVGGEEIITFIQK